MGLRYESLDTNTRPYVHREIDEDVRAGRLYTSKRLNDRGRAQWPALLTEAVDAHDDDWLAAQIRGRELLDAYEERKTKTGTTTVKVPVTAADTLAEGEFNRFYARGICARAIAEGISAVVVCRGKAVSNPRPESDALIGRRLSPEALLNDLRGSIGVDTALGVPGGPNSGLTVRLPR